MPCTKPVAAACYKYSATLSWLWPWRLPVAAFGPKTARLSPLLTPGGRRLPHRYGWHWSSELGLISPYSHVLAQAKLLSMSCTIKDQLVGGVLQAAVHIAERSESKSQLVRTWNAVGASLKIHNKKPIIPYLCTQHANCKSRGHLLQPAI